MAVYHDAKQLLTKHILNFQKRLIAFNRAMNAKKNIKYILKKYHVPKLTPDEVKDAKSFFKSKGYNLKNTYWHRYYKALNGEFHSNYIPDDLFRAIISPKLNQQRQWPALLDKNLTYRLFSQFNQPKPLVKNINGYYFINDEQVNIDTAVNFLNDQNKNFIIKPTIDSGQGKMVKPFKIANGITTFKQLNTRSLFEFYKKDFIVQEFLEQHELLKVLNPATLNTMRVMSYLREDSTYILSSILRIGKPNSETDNFSGGGIICGIQNDGFLKEKGFTKYGEILTETYTGIPLKDYKVPNFKSVINMVKSMHPIVPYFKIISWDIALDKDGSPYLIEYNTYNQSSEVHQIVNCPLFGEFTDEILTKGLESL